MQANTVQPLVNLTVSNIELFSRFVKSPEIAAITKVGIERYVDLVQDMATRMARTKAFVQLTQDMADNYARFTSEYLQNASGFLSQGQDLLSYQVEESSRRFRQITDATSRTVDVGADVVRRASEASSETLSRSMEVGSDAAQRAADAGADAVRGVAEDGSSAARSAAHEAADEAQHSTEKGANAVRNAAEHGSKAAKSAAHEAAAHVEDLHKARQQRTGTK